jgi:hypothetical protein
MYLRIFNRFLQNFQQELKVFLFLLALLSVFRAIFIFIYSYQLSDTSEIWLCMLYGLRLSLKTAGWIILVSFIITVLPNIFIGKWNIVLARKIWHSTAIFFLTICFFIKIPYYEIFNSGFDLMLINGAYDDFGAIVDTAIEGYQLFLRLPAAIIVSAVLIFILCKILNTKTYEVIATSKRTLCVYTVLSISFLVVFFWFVRYGGAFNYANSIIWENAARLKSHLLNEVILDDAQALYRVRSIYQRSQRAIISDIGVDKLKEQIKILGGNPNAANIEEAFLKEVGEQRIDEQPNNVVFILGETYALWPFLPEYKDLGLVQKGFEFQDSPNGLSVDFMLALGWGTMPTLNGLISGLADVGIYQNYEKESFKSVYGTGIGAVMKSFGYKTVFWYGGFDGWQNIKNFVLAQSFDEFHSSSEFETRDGNSWGGSDKLLFERIKTYMQSRQNEKIFHFILTTSNHAPHTIDVMKEGFERERERVKSVLPDTILNNDKTLNELGHIWYADQAMGNFIKSVEGDFSDTLFVITGDHADRFSFAKEVNRKTFSAVPCIFYGQAINKDKMHINKVGAHMQIIPTLAELVGKKGDKYSSILPTLFEDSYSNVFNHKLWANESDIGLLSEEGAPNSVKRNAEAAKTITIWRVKKGDKI